MTNMQTATYSFVIPIYNESETLFELFERMLPILEKLDGPSEVILVDDGSKDNSYDLMKQLNQKDNRFKTISLSRNFGHQVAITAGMDHSVGQATIILDSDLQDPPEVILEMVSKWKEGYSIVYGLRKEREQETLFKKVTASLFYRLLKKISEVDIPLDTGDFRLVDRKALNAFLQLRERNRYVRGMFSWIGFKQIGVTYKRQGRFAGTTKYPFKKMLRLASDGVIGFSTLPLRLSLKLGFIISSLSFLIGLWAIFLKLTGLYTVTGWTSLAVMVSFLGGTQLVMIGVLGEYFARMQDEIKGRPLYLIQEARGIDIQELIHRTQGLGRRS